MRGLLFIELSAPRFRLCLVLADTTKSYLKAYGKTKEAPASDPNSPLIKFKLGDPPVTAAAIKPKEEPKKEEPKKEEPKA